MDQFNEIMASLAKRKEDTLGSKKAMGSSSLPQQLILTSPSDLGVCRNGGRRGASYAPQAILAQLEKMIAPKTASCYQVVPVSDPDQELLGFAQSQELSAQYINNALSNFGGNSIIHLGGGHDHIYPLLMGVEKHWKDKFEKLQVINIDAHLDTRTDSQAHSGTPFRQFAAKCCLDFGLIQLGIHSYSNAVANYTKLPGGEMAVLSANNLAVATDNFKSSVIPFLEDYIAPCEKTLTLLSLDADALLSEQMEAVSAVNPRGLPLSCLNEIFEFYQNLASHHPHIVGVYEYNPLYDNLSCKGAKGLSDLLYSFF